MSKTKTEYQFDHLRPQDVEGITSIANTGTFVSGTTHCLNDVFKRVMLGAASGQIVVVRTGHTLVGVIGTLVSGKYVPHIKTVIVIGAGAHDLNEVTLAATEFLRQVAFTNYRKGWLTADVPFNDESADRMKEAGWYPTQTVRSGTRRHLISVRESKTDDSQKANEVD